MCTLQRPIQIASWRDQGALNVPESVLEMPWRALKLLVDSRSAHRASKVASPREGSHASHGAWSRPQSACKPLSLQCYHACCLSWSCWMGHTCVEMHAMPSIDYQRAIGDLADSCTACTFGGALHFGLDRCCFCCLELIRWAATPYRTSDQLPTDTGRDKAVERAQCAVAAAASVSALSC